MIKSERLIEIIQYQLLDSYLGIDIIENKLRYLWNFKNYKMNRSGISYLYGLNYYYVIKDYVVIPETKIVHIEIYLFKDNLLRKLKYFTHNTMELGETPTDAILKEFAITYWEKLIYEKPELLEKKVDYVKGTVERGNPPYII